MPRIYISLSFTFTKTSENVYLCKYTITSFLTSPRTKTNRGLYGSINYCISHGRWRCSTPLPIAPRLI